MGFLSWRPAFIVQVGLVVDTVALGYGFIRIFGILSVIISPVLCIYFIHTSSTFCSPDTDIVAK